MTNWNTTINEFTGQRWDIGYHEFQRMDFLAKWEKIYPTMPLGELIFDDSYGILTPGTVYSPENPVTFIRATDMRSHLEIDFSDALKVPEEYYRHERAHLRKNDVLLAIKGASIASSKSVSFIDFEPQKTIVNGTIFHFQVKEMYNPLFIAIMLDSEIVKGQIRKLQIPNNAVSYVDKPSIYSLRIPIPPQEIQEKIVDIMKNAYTTRNKFRTRIQEHFNDIDSLVFRRLEIFPEKVKEKLHFTKTVSELHNSRFDFAFNMGFHKFDPYINKVVPISKVAVFSNETQNPQREPEKIFNYIDIGSINPRTGEVENVSQLLGEEAPSRARQVVHAGDVIVSTVRPTRGAIAVVSDEMDGYVCSTGFAVIHPNQETSSEYLYAALRLSTTLEQFGRRSAGSSYPAILEKDIKETLIPLPSKEIQTEIASDITTRRTEIKNLLNETEKIVSDAKKEVEKVISGE